MPNQKISELTTATSPSVNDVLPIVNGGSTKKITAASLLTNSLSATTVSISALNVNNNVFFRAKGSAIAIGNRFTGQTSINNDSDITDVAWNIFLGFCAGKGIVKGIYNGRASYNIAIGHKAGYSLGGNDYSFCAGRTFGTDHNLLMGNGAGRYLCAGNIYTAKKNIALGTYSFGAAKEKACNNVVIGYRAAQYMCGGLDNVFIGYRAACDAGPRNICANTVIGSCAGRGLSCSSRGNIAIGVRSVVGVPSGYVSSATIIGAIAIGNYSCAGGCNSIAIGTNTYTRLPGDVVVGSLSRSRYSGGHMTVIGSCNCFTTSNIGSQLSGAIVIGSCNRDISTTFVLGSPVFPLSARPDTTLAGQVSSLFVTINGQNRRIAIFS